MFLEQLESRDAPSSWTTFSLGIIVPVSQALVQEAQVPQQTNTYDELLHQLQANYTAAAGQASLSGQLDNIDQLTTILVMQSLAQDVLTADTYLLLTLHA